MLLGALIEKVSGQNYFDYVREHIYRPAGMTDTDAYELDQDTPDLAFGYTRSEPDASGKRPWKNNLFLHVVKGGPAGGGFSTAPDLIRFAQALRSTGKLLRRVESAQTLYTGKLTATQGTPNDQYGYGFDTSVINGQRITGHGGGFPGINSNLDIFLDSGYTVAVMSNYDPPAAQFVANKVRELLTAKN
jgi:CubicO group peptidase (beta-lactamase class C family)